MIVENCKTMLVSSEDSSFQGSKDIVKYYKCNIIDDEGQILPLSVAPELFPQIKGLVRTDGIANIRFFARDKYIKGQLVAFRINK
jgi:hypothetical protein